MNSYTVDHVLKNFSPITLEEMDCVALMNRTELKFVFSSQQLPALLGMAPKFYRVLEINGDRQFAYTTTYLDTDDYQLFRHHISGKLNRYKARYRVYESTKVSYLEIKFKSNKGRTFKWRIKNKLQAETIDDNALNFLSTHFSDEVNLKPVQINKFNRITLVNLQYEERITIDYNLHFTSKNGEQVSLPYIAIAEIKQKKSTQYSPFRNILRENNIRPLSFSKYCVGNALLRVLPAKNAFKSTILTLEKFKNDHILHTIS
jgi:hypothetical protein